MGSIPIDRINEKLQGIINVETNEIINKLAQRLVKSYFHISLIKSLGVLNDREEQEILMKSLGLYKIKVGTTT